tara:strand:+ start:530 stop:820 length:291 start_codon:yes stop_codon:yes gene_type:complete
MEKFNIGLFIQESRSIDVEAESQEDAEQKVRDMLVEAGTEDDDMIQLYDKKDTKLEIREVEVIVDKHLIHFESPREIQPEYYKELESIKELENNEE